MKNVFSFVIFCLCVSVVNANVPQKIVNASVMVACNDGSGSGVGFKNKTKVFIWTDAHVVSGCQVIQKVFDAKTGKDVMNITYKDVLLKQPIVENGKHIGEDTQKGRIIRYCEKEDIALVEVYKENWLKNGTKFLPAKAMPKVGQPIFHVGSAYGTPGFGSFFKGYVSFVGRYKEGYYHDQIQITATWGCSGGGMFTEKGECIGLITQFLHSHQATPGMFLITPSRRLWEFSKRNDCLWAMDGAIAPPNTIDVITDDQFAHAHDDGKKMPDAK